MTPVTSPTSHRAGGLDDRLAALRADAEELLHPDPVLPDPERARQLIHGLDEALDLMGAHLRSVPMSAERSATYAERMSATVALQTRLRDHLLSQRFRSLQRTYDALARIRSVDSVAELVRVAPAELCRSCGFDRALISEVRGSTWIPTSMHDAIDPADYGGRGLQQDIDGIEIPLQAPLVEAEVARRGTATIVSDTAGEERTHQPLPGILSIEEPTSYVVAPILIGGRVVGFLHADARTSSRQLTVDDLDTLESFAGGIGLALQRVVLAERLQTQRRRVTETLESTAAAIAGIDDTEILLARRPSRRESGGSMERIAALDADIVRDAQIHGILTPRERDVLERLALGASNRQIADELVVGVSTVKSHVKHILRKLKATNRAEAVSRYLRLTESGDAASAIAR